MIRSTARNRLAGRVGRVDIGPVSAEVTLALPSGQEVTATLTSSAARRLNLAPGMEAVALVKASAVVLVTDFGGYALSARNQLGGTISRVERGAVTTLVGLTLPGGEVLTASVTNDSADTLPLVPGAPATAVFKAYSVMIGVRA